MNNSKVLIFGAGQINNLLVKKLISSGKSVLYVTDNFFGQANNLKHRNLTFISYRDIIFKELKVETTIFSWRNENRVFENKSTLLKWLESDKFHCEESFFLSSVSVYKDCDYPVTESNLNLENNVENNSKFIVEKFLSGIMSKKNSNHINLRISNVYGPTLDYGLISNLLKSFSKGLDVKIFNNLNITRDYVFIDDVIFAIVSLIGLGVESGIINVSTGKGVPLYEILEIFSTHKYNFGNYISVPATTKISSIVDCTKLSKIIDWNPFTIKNGIDIALGG